MDATGVKQDTEAKDQEIAALRKKVLELETQLGEAQKLIQKHLMEVSEVDLLKMKSADTLTKAKSVIFENTKMIKNQELQIGALHQQVESLRDVVKITKDLLEIRNLEVDQLESKIHCMEEKYKAEKERQDLMHQKLEQMIRHNGELKREYEAQLCLFQALRSRYDERELAKGVVDALREDIKLDKQKQTEQKNETKEIECPVIEQNKNEETDANKLIQNETKADQNNVEVVKEVEVSEQTEKQKIQVNTSVVNGSELPEHISTSNTEKLNPSVPNEAEINKNEVETSQSAEILIIDGISSSTQQLVPTGEEGEESRVIINPTSE